MSDKKGQQLRDWTYAHRVDGEDLEKAVNRFRIQIEKNSRHLEEREDLEPPYYIQAQIRIVDIQGDSQGDGIDKVSLLDWGDDPE